MPSFTPYVYRAAVTNVVDGDTYDVRFDLGFDVTLGRRVRLHGVDTAEIYGAAHDSAEYERGQAHLGFVDEWFRAAVETAPDPEWPLLAYTHRDRQGKYGRYLADFAPAGSPETLLTDALREAFPEDDL